jgi:hypothetical protein
MYINSWVENIEYKNYQGQIREMLLKEFVLILTRIILNLKKGIPKITFGIPNTQLYVIFLIGMVRLKQSHFFDK